MFLLGQEVNGDHIKWPTFEASEILKKKDRGKKDQAKGPEGRKYSGRLKVGGQKKKTRFRGKRGGKKNENKYDVPANMFLEMP